MCNNTAVTRRLESDQVRISIERSFLRFLRRHCRIGFGKSKLAYLHFPDPVVHLPKS